MDYKKTFIELAIQKQALQFGSFKLKSERVSPYFFNSGVFSDGKSISIICNLFSQLIKEKNLQFVNIFGPAYKGIPLAASLSTLLANSNNNETNFVYDRKDQKQHGEKGDIVGNFKDGNTLIVDDVITAGTAIKSTLEKLDKYNIKTNSLLVMLDREEKGSKKISASQELKEDYGIDVYSLINISDIIHYVSITGQFESYTKDIVAYKTKYGS